MRSNIDDDSARNSRSKNSNNYDSNSTNKSGGLAKKKVKGPAPTRNSTYEFKVESRESLKSVDEP